jgi:hypothetical protein
MRTNLTHSTIRSKTRREPITGGRNMGMGQ